MLDNEADNSRVKILIVEDSPTQAEELSHTLERHGFDVSVACNGVEALALINKRKPAIVISDILMPEMDGYQLCREIKKDCRLDNLSVILLTALSDPQDVVKGLECGADNFITKPYEEKYILSRIQYSLANRHLKDVEQTRLGVEIVLAGERYCIKSDRIQILNLLLSSYEAAIQKNGELIKAQGVLQAFNEQLEEQVKIRTFILSEEIKERKRTDAALKESEARYRHLLESVTDYIYTVQVANGQPAASSHGPGCAAVTGYVPEEFAADSQLWYRMVHEEDRPSVLEQAARVLSGEAHPLEHRIIHKGGGIRWVRNTPVLRRGQQGHILAYDGLITDITERKRAEEKIQQQQQFLEKIIESLSLPFYVIDVDDYTIKLANSAAGFGADPTGKTCYALTHNRDRPCDDNLCRCPLDIIRQTKRLVLVEHTHYASDGNARIVEVHGYPILDDAGNLVQMIAYSLDISERKQLEEERRILESQLFQAQKMEAVGQLAGGIAHDFNNILTVIIGFSSLMEMGMDKDDPQRENVEHVLAAADRAADLTRSLLAFSRKQIINPQPADLNRIIKKVGKFLLRIIGEDIDLRTSFCQDVLTVNADGGQIEQVLMNLATNARDAMPKGGMLSIETGPVEMDSDFIRAHGYGKLGEYALISVTDTGMGMDETTRKRLFEPFFTTKEQGKGTGLGLSIVYGIVKQHNGYINVYSEPGMGTTFTIYLPSIRTAVAERADGADEILQGGTETILVVDDDPTLRGLSEKVLGQFGYAVITAEDGVDAITKFSENKDRIALVILDVIMPRMNGKEAYDEIRKLRPDSKVIFISGYTADIIHMRGMLDEGLEFVTKPLSPVNLLKKVRKVLDRTS